MNAPAQKPNGAQFVVSATDGMVNIDSKHIAYSKIDGMYQNNTPGTGLQLSEALETVRPEIEELCNTIADAMEALSDIQRAAE